MLRIGLPSGAQQSLVSLGFVALNRIVNPFGTDVVEVGAEYLLIVCSFYLAFTSMSSTGGLLRGAGDTLTQMFITLAALWLVRIPVSAWLSSLLGSRGIWWGIPAGWVVGFTANFLYYRGGRWKRKIVVRPPGP